MRKSLQLISTYGLMAFIAIILIAAVFFEKNSKNDVEKAFEVGKVILNDSANTTNYNSQNNHQVGKTIIQP